MTPRVVGLMLIGVGLAVGVWSGFQIATPWWGIGAAIVLAFASVGMAAGVLLLSRPSWQDTSWPPIRPTERRPPNPRRQLLFGAVFLLAFAPVMIAVGIWAARLSDAGTRWRLIPVGAVMCIFGVVLLVLALQKPRAVTDDRPPVDVDTVDGWTPLGRAWIFSSSMPGFVLAFPATWILQAALLDIDEAPWLGPTIAAIATLCLVIGLLTMFARGQAWVNLATTQLRWGLRTVAFSDITAATLIASPHHTGEPRTLTLRLEGPRSFAAAVPIRTQERRLLASNQQAALLALVEGSAIAMPHDPNDPTGKFGRVLFPTNLTKEQASDIVLRPPTKNEELPVGLVAR